MQPPWWKASVVSLETSSFLDVDPWWLRQLTPWRGSVQTGKSRQFNGQLCSSAPPQFTVVGSYKRKISQRRFLYFRVSSAWAFLTKAEPAAHRPLLGIGGVERVHYQRAGAQEMAPRVQRGFVLRKKHILCPPRCIHSSWHKGQPDEL